MSQRRMFSPQIIDSDAFLDMSSTAQSLYFHLGMRADDDGFVGNPKKILRMIGGNDDDLKILLAKRFILAFDSGVIVIKHWRINNLIRKDWYKETIYLEEKNSLNIKENGSYTELVNENETIRSHRLGKVRLGKVSIGKNNTSTIVEADKSEYGNEDINWLIKEFETVMSFKSAGGGKDRLMAKHLLNNFSREQLTAMLQYCSSDKYAPRIGSVEKLWYKRGDVIAGIKSTKSNLTIIG